jgi:hypothetical protein
LRICCVVHGPSRVGGDAEDVSVALAAIEAGLKAAGKALGRGLAGEGMQSEEGSKVAMTDKRIPGPL